MPVRWQAIIWSNDGLIQWCIYESLCLSELTHWGRVTHICVGILTSTGSNNGLSPGRRQAIIRTNAGILLIQHLGTNFSEILIRIQAFSFKKMHLKMSSAKWRPFCLGLNVLTFHMLNSYHSSIPRWHTNLKCCLIEDSSLFILHSQGHGYLRPWRCKEPGHQLPWYWPSSPPMSLSTIQVKRVSTWWPRIRPSIQAIYVCFSFHDNQTIFAEIQWIKYLTLIIQGQCHQQNQTKSNQVIYKSILPKMKEIWEIVRKLLHDEKSAAGIYGDGGSVAGTSTKT